MLFEVKTVDVMDAMDDYGCLGGGRQPIIAGFWWRPGQKKKKRLALCGWYVNVPCEQTLSALDDGHPHSPCSFLLPPLFCHLVSVCSTALPPFIPESGHLLFVII